MRARVMDFTVEFYTALITVMLSCGFCRDGAHPLEVYMTQGLMILFVLHTTFTGGYANPAITILAYVFDRLPWYTALVYIMGQLYGSICGAYLLEYYMLKGAADKCIIAAGENDEFLVFIIETLAMSMYALSWLALWEDRFVNAVDMVILLLMFSHIGIAIATMPFKTTLNVIRTLGPNVISGTFKNYAWSLLSHAVSITLTSLFWKRAMENGVRAF